MYNLGIAHLYGLGVARRDPDLAAQWFEACGLPEGMFVVAMHRRASGKHEEAKEWEERASKLGFGKSWRKLARDRTGSGGVGGVNLHSAWDRHLQPGQEGPPTDWCLGYTWTRSEQQVGAAACMVLVRSIIIGQSNVTVMVPGPAHP